MKTILLAATLAICAGSAHATNYYFSATGDDTRSATQASNPATPWRSLTKLNAFIPSLKPGDSVLFRRGDTFNGNIKMTVSGTATAPIVFGAYGSGAKPVISALKKLGNWVSKGNGIYETTDATLGSRINVVSFNGNNQPIGRWPNSDQPLKGYMNFETVGTNTITDNELTSAINWTGAELVIRSSHWTLDKTNITAHTGSTLTYGTGVTYAPQVNYGYFIQNDVRTLDQIGEWSYNASRKAFSIFLGANTPSNFNIQASFTGDAFAIFDDNYIKVQNLVIEGGNENGVDIYSSDYITIEDCTIRLCGQNGIWAAIAKNLVIEDNSILSINSNGIMLPSQIDHAVIRNNVIEKSGMIAGMGQNGNNADFGIRVLGDDIKIENNTIDSSGYGGIRFDGDNITISNNMISMFALVKDDVGGIYSSTQSKDHYGRKVINNIIVDGIGAKEGTPYKIIQQASGIYLDDNVTSVDLIGNTITRCGKNGIYLHNNQKINLIGNICYDNTNQIIINHDNEAMMPIRNVYMKGNIFFGKGSKQQVAQFNSKKPDIDSFGIFEANYYLRPVDDNVIIQAIVNLYTSSSITSKYNLDQWKTAYDLDRDSKRSPHTFPITSNTDSLYFFTYNATKSSLPVTLPGLYADATGKTFNGSIVLEPFTSAVLMKINEVVTLPTATMLTPSTNSSFDAPANIRITGAATDPDGIRRVEFYNGTTLLGVDSLAPFEFNWNGVAKGNYALWIKAVDNKGNSSNSNNADIRVVNSNPIISLVNPIANAIFDAPANILIKANASDSDGIAKVEFYNGETMLHADTSAPFEFTFKNLQPGIFSVWAKAYDIKGYTTSTVAHAVSVVNSNPVISLNSPVTGSSFDAPGTVIINATATDVDGIAYVAFYNGTTLLSVDSAAPYTYTQSKLQPGTYSFYAKAADVKGYVTMSDTTQVKIIDSNPAINLITPTTAITLDAPATFDIVAHAADLDGIEKVDFYNGTILVGTDFTAPYNINLSNLAPGTYNISAKAYDVKGYSASTDTVACTVVDSRPSVALTSPVSSNSYATPASVLIAATAMDTDGIARVEFYNGTNLLATDNVAPYEFMWNGVAPGSYSISARAIDIKGYSTNSANATISITNQAPVVALTSPVAGSSFQAPATVIVAANASDADGIARVEFLRNGVVVNTDSVAPYGFTWTNAAGGTYSFTARAIDTRGLATTSAAASITIAGDKPIVKLTSPVANAIFTAPGSVRLTATASDADGIQRVEFYQGTTLLITEKTAPYDQTWSNVAAGTYTVQARAYDKLGNMTLSNVATITVKAPVLTTTNTTVNTTTQTTTTSSQPVVTLTSPLNGAVYNAPASFTLSANASDADGISKVEFYQGNKLIDVEYKAPYTFNYAKVPAGNYTFTAKAYDKKGQVTTSTTISVVVRNTLMAIGQSSALPAIWEAPAAAKLYPNPATSMITVQLGSQLNGNTATLSIVDMQGKVVLQRSVNISGNSLPVDITALSKGNYILTLTNNMEKVNLKFIKQ